MKKRMFLGATIRRGRKLIAKAVIARGRFIKEIEEFDSVFWPWGIKIFRISKYFDSILSPKEGRILYQRVNLGIISGTRLFGFIVITVPEMDAPVKGVDSSHNVFYGDSDV